MKRSVTIVFLAFFYFYSSPAHAQVGGNGIYKFLNLPNSARIGAMGGNFQVIYDDDITLAHANPSLITAEMHNQVGLNFVNYFAGINYGYAQYGRHFSSIGSFVGTLQFIDYGRFQEANEAGVKYGEFSASEYAMNIGWGRPLAPKWSIGADLKFIYSSLESYNSFGMAVDVAGTYHDDEADFAASLIFRNMGYQIVAYDRGNHEPLPFEIQAGLSKKFKHLPFRISMLLTHLERWDLSYENPSDPQGGIDPITGDPKKRSGVEEFADNFMRHIVVGGEFMFGKNFSIRGGYNYQRRQEMTISEKKGLVGFSWGFGFRVTSFQFSYARSTYHLVGSPNYITVTMDIDRLSKKKIVADE